MGLSFLCAGTFLKADAGDVRESGEREQICEGAGSSFGGGVECVAGPGDADFSAGDSGEAVVPMSDAIGGDFDVGNFCGDGLEGGVEDKG